LQHPTAEDAALMHCVVLVRLHAATVLTEWQAVQVARGIATVQ
jgi:hypothetical protein